MLWETKGKLFLEKISWWYTSGISCNLAIFVEHIPLEHIKSRLNIESIDQEASVCTAQAQGKAPWISKYLSGHTSPESSTSVLRDTNHKNGPRARALSVFPGSGLVSPLSGVAGMQLVGMALEFYVPPSFTPMGMSQLSHQVGEVRLSLHPTLSSQNSNITRIRKREQSRMVLQWHPLPSAELEPE